MNSIRLMFPNLDFNIAYPSLHALDPSLSLSSSSQIRTTYEHLLNSSWDHDLITPLPLLFPGSLVPHVPISDILDSSSNLELTPPTKASQSLRQLMSTLCLETGKSWNYYLVLGSEARLTEIDEDKNALVIHLMNQGENFTKNTSKQP